MDTPQKSFIDGHALLIGVGADLPVTVHDATALHDVLVDSTRASYPEDQVELLTEESADRTSVLDAFDRLIEQVNQTPDSATVIIYFSGHGGRVQSTNELTDYFLVTHGYDLNRRAETTISGLEFTRKIEAIQARKLVVLLDCCHAGGMPTDKKLAAIDDAFVKSPIPPELLVTLESGSGRVIIASSHEDEASFTGTPYSVFTACLLEALAGNAAVNQDGFARILDILIYLFAHVPSRTTERQHPFVKKVLDLGDNFPLCYYAGGSKQLPGTPSSLPDTPLADTLTSGQRRRLTQKQSDLQQEWDLWNEKIGRLRAALAIEAATAVSFQLEKQLLDAEAHCARVSDELDAIEEALS